jgi:phosphatidylinositol-3-phosphatase
VPIIRITRVAAVLVAAGAMVIAAGVVAPATAAPPQAVQPAALPRPSHVVILIEENHAFSQINGSATYLTSLGKGALFTQSFAVTHPSEPNYLALFSGSTQGSTDDSCPHTLSGANLASKLIGASLTFTGYSERMPSDGYTGCTSGPHARKHNPWVDFSNVPSADNLRFSRFPTDFTTLPTVTVVVPNLNDDMHDGSVSTGDTWAKNHIDAYAQWAKTHNSLLIVTFDEDDDSHGNQIFTVFYGQPVKVGSYSEHITHYSVLLTIENMYRLACTGNAGSATGITDAFN